MQLLAQHPDKTILVITPTRELALQVCEEMQKFCKYLGITPAAIYGGEPLFKQLKRLKNDARVLVGTPGRLLDLFKSKKLTNFSPLLVVLDEADEMLNMGFLEDIQLIFSYLPKERQTLLFSATMPPKIRAISTKFLKNPVSFDHASDDKKHKDIEQKHYLVKDQQRKLALLQLLQFHIPSKAIIFCNTKRLVDELSSELLSLGYLVSALQGDMSQADRQSSIERFRKATKMILVATDVAGRGIDVSDVSHVFNYELPQSHDAYTHRIGRTGRMGSKGTAITLLTMKQSYSFKRFLKVKDITFSKLPTIAEIKSKQHVAFLESLNQGTVHSDAQEILSFLQKEMSLEEIAIKLVSQKWSKQSKVLQKQLDASDSDKPSRKKRERERPGRNDFPARRKRARRDSFGKSKGFKKFSKRS
ncbi:MAG: DEAD/DEAH box helicase [Chlamydiae bacterium CG10_big_fil_rev_8_21_14_0_10_35_9]|nr:MAG: DEAD/DEAH box helicase [Chlamydiae bacterium CG10_big_fil_rev_8_21_14_0_10_35_9]